MAAGLGRETAHALLEHSRQALSREALLPSSLWIAGKSFKIGTECMNVIAGDIQLGLRSIDREADALELELELELIVLSYLTDAVVFTWVFFWGGDPCGRVRGFGAAQRVPRAERALVGSGLCHVPAFSAAGAGSPASWARCPLHFQGGGTMGPASAGICPYSGGSRRLGSRLCRATGTRGRVQWWPCRTKSCTTGTRSNTVSTMWCWLLSTSQAAGDRTHDRTAGRGRGGVAWLCCLCWKRFLQFLFILSSGTFQESFGVLHFSIPLACYCRRRRLMRRCRTG